MKEKLLYIQTGDKSIVIKKVCGKSIEMDK